MQQANNVFVHAPEEHEVSIRSSFKVLPRETQKVLAQHASLLVRTNLAMLK